MSDDPHANPSAQQKTADLFPIGRLIVDIIITGIFWVFMAIILRPHVPSDDPFWITVWSCITSLCLSGVFFMSLQMFRLVLHDKGDAQ